MEFSKEIDQEFAGKRLDRVIANLSIDFSLRGARRLIANRAATINGRAASASYKPKVGDYLEIKLPEGPKCSVNARLLEIQKDYCFFYKPPKMHSVSLAGKRDSSLEAAIPQILAAKGIEANIELLQRLDFGTGGIICGAATAEAARLFRQLERAGKCRKYYMALLRGELKEAASVKKQLSGRNKLKMRVLSEEAPENYWTEIKPLAIRDGQTLAACAIRLGQRHQIRAHTAALGYPLVYDSIYGQAADNGDFMLECCGISFHGHEFFHLAKDSPLASWHRELGKPVEAIATLFGSQ